MADAFVAVQAFWYISKQQQSSTEKPVQPYVTENPKYWGGGAWRRLAGKETNPFLVLQVHI